MNSPDPPSVTANLTRSPGREGGISARLHCQVIKSINSNFDLLLGESEHRFKHLLHGDNERKFLTEMLPWRKFSHFQVEAKPEAQIVWKQGLREIGQEVGRLWLWWILLFGGIFLWPPNLMAMLSRWARWWHWSEEDSQSWSWRMWKGRTLALSPVLPKILSERLQPCSSFQVTSSALQVLSSVFGETLLLLAYGALFFTKTKEVLQKADGAVYIPIAGKARSCTAPVGLTCITLKVLLHTKTGWFLDRKLAGYPTHWRALLDKELCETGAHRPPWD